MIIKISANIGTIILNKPLAPKMALDGEMDNEAIRKYKW